MTTLASQITQSVETLRAMTSDPDTSVPIQLLQKCRGIVFLTELKAGFIWSGSVAGGILISRLDGGTWSAPSSLGSGGVGFGFQVGASKTDTLLLLFDTLAVKTFASAGSLKFGGDVSVAAGPLGRSVQADARLGTQGATGCLSYSMSQGLFGGLSITGSVILARDADNAAFYKQKVSVNDLIAGKVAPPPEAQPLYDALNAICSAPFAEVSAAGSAPPPPPPEGHEGIYKPTPPPPPPEGHEGIYKPA